MSLKERKWKKIFSLIKNIYTPVTFGFILFFLYKNSALFKELFLNAKLSYLVTSVCIWASLHLLAPISSQLLLRSHGYTLSYKDLLRIHILRLPARYLPGGIWHTVGRLTDYHSLGITKKHLTLLALFESIFPIPVAFFIGGSLLWFFSPGALPNSLEIIATVVSSILLLLPLCLAINNPLDKYFSSRILPFYFCLLLLALVFWLLAAWSFVLYYNAIPLVGSVHQSFLSLAGAYIFSWGAGYISVFAPQGIGVFELVAGRIIDIPMSLGSAFAFLAGFRLIALLADFSAYCFFFFIPFAPRKDYSPSSQTK
jgi:hypothetical protein